VRDGAPRRLYRIVRLVRRLGASDRLRLRQHVWFHPGHPHAHAYAPASCGPVQTQYLIVYRPDHAAPVKLPYATTACFKRVQMLQISAISPGTGG
jgi:hypothetical protein